MPSDSPQPAVRPPHPLATELIERFAPARPVVLEVGAGSGRNTRALRAAGSEVVGLDDSRRVDACLSTHTLLHGTPPDVALLLGRLAVRLPIGAPLYATFGSRRDARCGTGVRLGNDCFAPSDGDERGIAHTYFDETALRALLSRDWHVESLREVAVDEIAGAWAHAQRPLHGAVHWFAVAIRV